MSTMMLVSGLPGSGKTTWALGWVAEDPVHRRRLNYDELRVQLYGPNWHFNIAEENAMKNRAMHQVKAWLQQGLDVVIDNTNLAAGARYHWESLAARCGAQVTPLELDTSVAQCIANDRHRGEHGGSYLGRAVIERMALLRGFLDLTDTSHYPHDFIVCDIDGTLADGAHREHLLQRKCLKCGAPGDWQGKQMRCSRALCDSTQFTKKDWWQYLQLCYLDTPIEPIFQLLQRLVSGTPALDILMVSGRPTDPCGLKTEQWLDREFAAHGLTYRHLFMRGSTHSSDVLVKQEILDLLPTSRLRYVIDDRASVCNGVWRKAGLTCLQVREGNF
jgi:predicted kinase